MISIEQFKQILEIPNLSDEQVSELRDLLYVVVEQVFDTGEIECKNTTALTLKSRHDESVGT